MSKNILITSGPTRGPIDAVRYISNKSSGKLGSLIGTEALLAGHSVTYIYGRGSYTPDIRGVSGRWADRLRLLEVVTVDDVMSAVNTELKTGKYDAAIHLMAVLDYVPEAYIDRKCRSGEDQWYIKLVKTPKVITRMREFAPDVFLMSFKLEYNKSENELLHAAYQSLQKYDSDICVVNDLKLIENGKHIAYFVNKNGEKTARAEGKQNIAEKIVEIISGL